MTITDFCDEINNYFVSDRKFGTFTIENGALTGVEDFLCENQYFRIVNAVFNEGVYKYPTTDLTDETFNGAIWAMAVPPAALALLEDIQEWDDKYGNSETASSPFQSENFGSSGYSYTLKTGGSSSTNSADPTTWQGHFKYRLNRWRKI